MRAAGYPAAAIVQNLTQGHVIVEFTITVDDRVVNVRAVESTHPVFSAAAVNMVSQYRCKSFGREVLVRVPFNYRLEP